MRVTNSMLSNSTRSHIMNAKQKLLKYEEQYTSEKKIQRPSDDPTVAVRSLKFRSTLSQINQYVEKNVQDAMSWMDITESAMKNIDSLLTDIKGYLNQGANDPLAVDERQSVLSALEKFVSAIFEDEANSDYSGRYVFAGYRTDTSLLFPSNTTTLAYNITENFSYSDIDTYSVISGGAVYDSTITDGQDYTDMAASLSTAYRVQLAYKNCSNSSLPMTDGNATGMPSGTREDYVQFTMTYKNDDGDEVSDTVTAVTKASTDDDAYEIGDDEVIYLYDTGEVLMGANVYSSIQQNQSAITVEYCKADFEKSDIRPEMYFECTSYNSVSGRTISYSEPANEDIEYEINFNQMMKVNTQARDAISTDIYRAIDYIAQTVSAVDDIENRIAEVETMISKSTDSDEISTLTSLKTTLEAEKDLRVKVMTEAFGKGLTMVDEAQSKLNVSLSELGSKYNRLELTYEKLLDQQLGTEERLSNNEDVDIADAYINLTQADNLYMYSLSATSKVLGNTLLDYI